MTTRQMGLLLRARLPVAIMPCHATKSNMRERDQVNLEAVAEFGRPFWLAGGYDSPEKLKEAQDRGANAYRSVQLF